MKRPLRKHLDHSPPRWLAEESVYFTTLCGQPRQKNQFCLEAVDRLVDLIKENGKWFDAPVPVAAG